MTRPRPDFDWRGRILVDRDGHRLGRIEDVYLDPRTHDASFAVVRTGIFGTRIAFMPLREVAIEDERARAPYARAQVEDAPAVDPYRELSPGEEAALYRHYAESRPRPVGQGPPSRTLWPSRLMAAALSHQRRAR
jgi:hypothetical protein